MITRGNASLGIVTASVIAAGLLGTLIRSDDQPRGSDEVYKARRQAMVAEQVEVRGIRDPFVLAAMREVPRHRFVPDGLRAVAYDDSALPIGRGQTISQPYIVALMTSLIKPNAAMRVLEVGTGSGYQAAVLARCVKEVETIEVIPELGQRAEATLTQLGVRNVHVHIGDGFDGWPAKAPYDAIVLTAAPEHVPQPLLDQLKPGGRLVAPVGKGEQNLVVLTKTPQGTTTEVIEPVLFVPMIGKAQHGR